MFVYFPKPRWRPLAVFENSSCLFLTNLMILVCRIHFCCYFYHSGTYLPTPVRRLSAILEKSFSLFLTPLSAVIPLVLIILLFRIHFQCSFQHWGSIFVLTRLLTILLCALVIFGKLIFVVSYTSRVKDFSGPTCM